MSNRGRRPRGAVCEFCGANFTAYRSVTRFCGRSCAGRASRIGKSFAGTSNPRFNGGLSTWQGRAVVVFRDGGHMLYSRAIMAGHLGRLLRRDEIVHHINGDPTDDRIENLQIVSRAEHIAIHRAELQAARAAKEAAR